jgi:hypothetical protein
MGNGHIEGVKDHDSNRNRHSPLGEFLRVDEKNEMSLREICIETLIFIRSLFDEQSFWRGWTAFGRPSRVTGISLYCL